MKLAASLLAGLSLACASPASAGKSAPAATDWKAVAKTSEGKTITLSVIGTDDIGLVASDAPYAVVPVTPVNADNREMPTLPALMAPDRVEVFLKTITPVRTGGHGVFGGKVRNGTFTGTFVTLAGEYAVVIGDVKPVMKAKKPSEILAVQRDAAKAAGSDPDTTKRSPAKTPAP